MAPAKLLQEALQEARGGGGEDGGTADEIAAWRAFLRGVRTVSVAQSASSPMVAEVKAACVGLGAEVSGEVVTRAAEFLLDELVPLEDPEVRRG